MTRFLVVNLLEHLEAKPIARRANSDRGRRIDRIPQPAKRGTISAISCRRVEGIIFARSPIQYLYVMPQGRANGLSSHAEDNDCANTADPRLR
ncbi:MAG: hypothetical protein IT426_15530 [Pirellulales bacterium]|nr:hypothetical protein [Pirellulales bacterium]